MGEAVSIDFSRPLPLFPLPNCVLLPQAVVPLHIFEPRYRAMLRDALDSHGLIAMAILDNPRDKQADHPSLREHVCLGRVARHELLPDGRYNILLQGICRARIHREVEDNDVPYRQAILEPTENAQAMEIDLDEPREQLNQLLEDELLQKLAAVSAISQWNSAEVPTPALVDLAVLTVCHGLPQRYAMLAEPDPAARARWLIGYLRQTRRTLEQAERFGPSLSEDGLSLN